MCERTLVLLSGGLDSAVLVHFLRKELHGLVDHAIFFDRKQGALVPETAAAKKVAKDAEIELYEVSIREWREKFPGKVPMETIPRNTIMSLLSIPYAAATGCSAIALGSNLDDAKTVDSNEKYFASFNALLDVCLLYTSPSPRD